MNVFVAVGGLLLLVFVHELGHFLAAKAVGMRATRFYVGFPPAIAKLRRGDTEYGVGAIPLGGYVRIVGMMKPRMRDLGSTRDAVQEAARRRPLGEPDGLGLAYGRLADVLDRDDAPGAAARAVQLRDALEAERGLVDPERLPWCEKELDRVVDDADERAYWRQPTWKRIVVIAAGPAANVIAAFLILTIFALSGEPRFNVNRVIDQVGASSPAQSIGVRSGDKVVAVNGVATPNTVAIRKQIQKPGAVTLTVVRDGQRVRLGPVQPVKSSSGRLIGVEFTTVRAGTYHQGPVAAARSALDDMWFTTSETFKALGQVVSGGQHDQLTTPVGIVQQSETSVNDGVYPRLLALISLSLAIFNMLPFLPLDGGHIVFAIVEGVRKRPLGREVYERVSAIGIALMLVLFAIGISNDVGRITNGPRLTP